MAANESTDRLHVADRLPLEYPPREIARIYGARLGLLLLTLALLAVVMLLLYFLAAAIRDRDATPFVAALTGALIGWLGRPEVRAQLRARVRGIINPARFDPPTDRAPGHRAH